MGSSILESFPWQWLEYPAEPEGELLVRWIYTHFAPRAYQAFLELGRGLLVGPFLTDEDKNPISSEEALRRRRERVPVDLTITYVAVNDPLFERTLPDAALRTAVRGAVDNYTPEKECVVLVLADNVPHIARIVGAMKGAALGSPKRSYEALFDGTEARLAN